jgi:hypothetical protein
MRVAEKRLVTRPLRRILDGTVSILQAFGGVARWSTAFQKSVSPELFCSAICKRHFAERKPRVCIQQILIPQQFCRLNCGFTSDRPFACVFQKTDVFRDPKDSARTVSIAVYKPSCFTPARKGLSRSGNQATAYTAPLSRRSMSPTDSPITLQAIYSGPPSSA